MSNYPPTESNADTILENRGIYLTQHARIRLQQRGISHLILEWLHDYGSIARAKDGATIHYFDKKSRKKLRAAIGNQVYAKMQEFLDIYFTEIDSRVITVGHRYKRIRNL